MTELEERGATVVGYVPQNAVMIGTGEPGRLEGLESVRWIGALAASDKLSAALDLSGIEESGDAISVMVEFHPDVDPGRARELVTGAGAEVRDNPDLPRKQLLARAGAGPIRQLAEFDEVAYIFPAAEEIVAGRPMIACDSALTPMGTAGQYIAKVGDGWDGPGKRSAALTYTWGTLTAQLPAESQRAEIIRALNEWSKVAAVSFSEGTRADALRNIAILFGSRGHGDSYPFDGTGGVLAHTFYPAPPNPEPLAGDMHIDDDEHWRIGADTDLFSVALHELGHALGLGHSDRPGAVMYPYYQRANTLTPEDIGAIQELYAAAGVEATPTPPTTPTTPTNPTNPTTPIPETLTLTTSVPPGSTTAETISINGSTSGGTGAVTVRWSSSRGSAGAAANAAAFSLSIGLLTGSNTITVTASDAAGASVTRAMTVVRQAQASAVSLQVTYPSGGAAYSTTSQNLNVKGSAQHASGIRSVAWANSRGGAGAASGTASWDSGAIALANGVNTITITATAMDGTSATAAVQITLVTAGAKDTTAPAVAITSPGSATYTTSADNIVLKGTASDNLGVARIAWFTGDGRTGEVAVAANWQTPAIPIYVGFNTIVVRVFDAAGNMAWRLVQVTRR